MPRVALFNQAVDNLLQERDSIVNELLAWEHRAMGWEDERAIFVSQIQRAEQETQRCAL